MISRLKAWWESRNAKPEPPSSPKPVLCQCCHKPAPAMRRYTDGTVWCVPCAEKRRK